MSVTITFDGKRVPAFSGATLLQAAWAADVYIPSLCAHPDLPSQCCGSDPASAIYVAGRRVEHDPKAEGPPGCGLCVVEVRGEGQVEACGTVARDGMEIVTGGTEIEAVRKRRLARILAHHPHACLTCAQREGCTREPCSMNVPKAERCCELLGRCELGAVVDYIGIDPATPRYVAPEYGRVTDEPLFDRNPALCVACGRCVRACKSRDVAALGWVRNSSGRTWVGPVAETPIKAGCRLCGSCVEVCPTGALVDRGIKPAEREKALVPCRAACPAGTDVPRYVRLVAEGRLAEAAAVVAERAPLVEVLGNVCFHPCEAACRRNDVNQAPISICRIKREAGAASASAWAQSLPAPRSLRGKNVAVVGGGPSGLVAAYALRLLGYAVTLFEARASLGGMLAFGIPPFRLGRDIVRRETDVLARGVEVRTNSAIGDNGLSIEGLRKDYHAVIVATGAPKSRGLGVDGEDLPGISRGLEFLADIAQGRLASAAGPGQRVAVIGGGNVAMDCARALVRLGVKQVDLVCLEQPHEMPAWQHEIEAARTEGVRFHHGWGIAAFRGDDKLRALGLKRCTRVFDADGRFSPAYDGGDTETIEADAAVIAIGQAQDRSILPQSLKGIFTAGDLATGPKSVVEAIASGRETALAVDRYLGGEGVLDLHLGPEPVDAVSATLGRVDAFTRLACVEVVRDEANRCLQCDLRLGYHRATRPPPRQSRLAFDETSLAHVPAVEGVLRFYDRSGALLAIIGSADMHTELSTRLSGGRAAALDFEPCPMYTQRQNELLSHYLEAHGRMPPGISAEDNLDDLF